MKNLYVSLGKPLRFGVWEENGLHNPMGWHRADYIIDKDYEWNKLKVLTMDELIEIKKELKRFAESGRDE